MTRRAVNARITSISVRYDEHAPEGGHLDGAKNVMLPITGHFRLVGHPRALHAVLQEIEALGERDRGPTAG